MANDASRVNITWTPIANAYGQAVQRREYGTSTWTNLISVQGSGMSSYTDSTATDMDPQTVYEYRIKTQIYYQPDVYTTIDSDLAKNCPTAGITNIFGFKNETNGGGNALDFTWFDPEAEWLNQNWGTSKSTARNMTITSQSSGSRIPLGCHKCGELVDYSISPISGNSIVNGDFSYMTDYVSIASWLPTPISAFGGNANSNMGNIIRKLDVTYTQQIGGTKFQLGVGNQFNPTFYPFNGKKLTAFGHASQAPTYSPTLFGDYNFKTIPNTAGSNQIFTGIKIGTAGNNTLDTALANISGSNTYVAIVDEQFTQNSISANTPYKCHMHMYKLTRWSGWDYTAINSYRARGFKVTYHNTLVIPISGSSNTYEIASTQHSDVNFYSENISTNPTTNRRAQPQVYLKIFTV